MFITKFTHRIFKALFVFCATFTIGFVLIGSSTNQLNAINSEIHESIKKNQTWRSKTDKNEFFISINEQPELTVTTSDLLITNEILVGDERTTLLKGINVKLTKIVPGGTDIHAYYKIIRKVSENVIKYKILDGTSNAEYSDITTSASTIPDSFHMINKHTGLMPAIFFSDVAADWAAATDQGFLVALASMLAGETHGTNVVLASPTDIALKSAKALFGLIELRFAELDIAEWLADVGTELITYSEKKIALGFRLRGSGIADSADQYFQIARIINKKGVTTYKVFNADATNFDQNTPTSDQNFSFANGFSKSVTPNDGQTKTFLINIFGSTLGGNVMAATKQHAKVLFDIFKSKFISMTEAAQAPEAPEVVEVIQAFDDTFITDEGWVKNAVDSSADPDFDFYTNSDLTSRLKLAINGVDTGKIAIYEHEEIPPELSSPFQAFTIYKLMKDGWTAVDNEVVLYMKQFYLTTDVFLKLESLEGSEIINGFKLYALNKNKVSRNKKKASESNINLDDYHAALDKYKLFIAPTPAAASNPDAVPVFNEFDPTAIANKINTFLTNRLFPNKAGAGWIGGVHTNDYKTYSKDFSDLTFTIKFGINPDISDTYGKISISSTVGQTETWITSDSESADVVTHFMYLPTADDADVETLITEWLQAQIAKFTAALRRIGGGWTLTETEKTDTSVGFNTYTSDATTAAYYGNSFVAKLLTTGAEFGTYNLLSVHNPTIELVPANTYLTNDFAIVSAIDKWNIAIITAIKSALTITDAFSTIDDDGNPIVYTLTKNGHEFTLTLLVSGTDAQKIKIATDETNDYLLSTGSNTYVAFVDLGTIINAIDNWLALTAQTDFAARIVLIDTALVTTNAWIADNDNSNNAAINIYTKTIDGIEYTITLKKTGIDAESIRMYTTYNSVESIVVAQNTPWIDFNTSVTTSINQWITDQITDITNALNVWTLTASDSDFNTYTSPITAEFYGNNFTLKLMKTGSNVLTYSLYNTDASIDILIDASTNTYWTNLATIMSAIDLWNTNKITEITVALNGGTNGVGLGWGAGTDDTQSNPNTKTYTKVVQGITFTLVVTTTGADSQKFQLAVTAFGSSNPVYPFDSSNSYSTNVFQTDLSTISEAITNWITAKMTAIQSEITNANAALGADNTTWSTADNSSPYTYTKMEGGHTFTLTFITAGADTGKFSLRDDSVPTVYLLLSTDSTSVEYTNIAAINSEITKHIAALTGSVTESNTKILTDDSWTENVPSDSNLEYINFSKSYMASDGATYNFELKINSNGENIGKFWLRYNPSNSAEANIYLDSDGYSTAITTYEHTLTDAAAITSLLSTWTDAHIATENLKTKLEAASWSNIGSTLETITHVYFTKSFSPPTDDAVKFFIAIEKTGINAGKFELYTSDVYNRTKNYEATSPTNLFLINAVTGAKETLDGADLLVGANYSSDQIETIINMYLNDLYLTTNDWAATTADSSHLKYQKSVNTHVFTLKLESSGDDVNKFIIETGATNIDIHSDLESVYTSAETLIANWFTTEISNIDAAIEAAAWSTKTDRSHDLYTFTLSRAGLTFYLELNIIGDDIKKYAIFTTDTNSVTSGTKTYYNIDGTSSTSKVAITYSFDTNNAAATILAINNAALIAIEASLTDWNADAGNSAHDTLNTYTKLFNEFEYTLTVMKTTAAATKIEITTTFESNTVNVVDANTAWVDYATSVATPIEAWAEAWATRVKIENIVSALTGSTIAWTQPDLTNKPNTYEKNYSGMSFFIEVNVTGENAGKYTIYTTTDGTVNETKNYFTTPNWLADSTVIDSTIATYLVALINTELLDDSSTAFNPDQLSAGTDTNNDKVYTITIYGTEFTLHLQKSTGMIKLFKTADTVTYLLGSSSDYVDYYSSANDLNAKLSEWNSALIDDIKTSLTTGTIKFETTADTAQPTVYIQLKNGHTFTLTLEITGANARKIKIATDESEEYLLGTSSTDYVDFINLSTINNAINDWLAARISNIDSIIKTNSWAGDAKNSAADSKINKYTKTIDTIEYTITLKKTGDRAESTKIAGVYSSDTNSVNVSGFTLWADYDTSVNTPIATWLTEINTTALLAIEEILVRTNHWTAAAGNLVHETLNIYTKEIDNIEYTLTLKKTTADAKKIQITTTYESNTVNVVAENTAWVDYAVSVSNPIEAWVGNKLSIITDALTGSSTAWTLTNPQTLYTYEKTYSGKKFFIDITASGNDLGKYTIYTTSDDVQSSTKAHLTTSESTSAAEQLISFDSIAAIDTMITNYLVALIDTELLAASATEFKPDGAWAAQTHENLYKVFASTIYGTSFTLHLEIATGKIKVFETDDTATYLLGSSTIYVDYFDAANNVKTQLLAWNNKKITAIDAILISADSGQHGWTLDTSAQETSPTTKTYTKTVQGITFNLVLTTDGENSGKFKLAVTAFGTTSPVYPFDTANNYATNDFQTDVNTISDAISNWINTKMTAIKAEITNADPALGAEDNTRWTTTDSTSPYEYTKVQDGHNFLLVLNTEGDHTGKFSLRYSSDQETIYLLSSYTNTLVEYTNIAVINSAVTNQVAKLTENASEAALANTAILTADDAWIAGNPIAATDSNLGYTDLTKTYTPSAGSPETYNFKIKLLTNGEFSLFFDHASADDIYLNGDGQSTLSSSTDHVISESSVSDINNLLEIWTVSYAATEALKSKLLVGSAWTLVDNTNDPLAKIYYTKTFSDPSVTAVKFFIAIEKTGATAGKFELYISDTYDGTKSYSETPQTNLFLINAVTGAKETLNDADLLVGADYSADQIATIINMYLNDRYLLSNDWTSSSTDSTHLIYTKTVRGHEFTLKLESSSDNVNKYKLEVAGNVFSISFETDLSNTKTDELILAWFTSEISDINSAIEATAWSTKSSTTDDLHVFTLARAGINFSLELTVTGDDTGKFTLSSPASGIKTYYNIMGIRSVSKVAIAYTETDTAAATILAINSAAVRAIDEILTSPSNNPWTAAEGNSEHAMLNTYTNTIDDIDYTLTVKKTTTDATKIKLLATSDSDHEFIVAPENTVWVDYNTSVTAPIKTWINVKLSTITTALINSPNAWMLIDSETLYIYKNTYSGKEFFIDINVGVEHIKYTIYTTNNDAFDGTKAYLTAPAGSTNDVEQLISFTDISAIDAMIADHLVALINTELRADAPTVFNPVQWSAGTDTDDEKVYTTTIHTTEFTLHLEIATGKIKLFHSDAPIYVLGSATDYVDYYDTTTNVKASLLAWNSEQITTIKTALVTGTDAFSTTDESTDPIVYTRSKNGHTFTVSLVVTGTDAQKIKIAIDETNGYLLSTGSDAYVAFVNLETINTAIDAWLDEQITTINTALVTTNAWLADNGNSESSATNVYTKTISGIKYTLTLKKIGENTGSFKMHTTYNNVESIVALENTAWVDYDTSVATSINQWITAQINAITIALNEWTLTATDSDFNIYSSQMSADFYGNEFTLKLFKTGDHVLTYSLLSGTADASDILIPAANHTSWTDVSVITTSIATWNDNKIAALHTALIGIDSGQYGWTPVDSGSAATSPTSKSYTKDVQGITFSLVLTTEGVNSRKFKLAVTAFGSSNPAYPLDTDNNFLQNDFHTALNAISAAITTWIDAKMIVIQSEITNNKAAWTTSSTETPYVYTMTQAGSTFTLTLSTAGADTGMILLHDDSTDPVYLLGSSASTFVKYTNIDAINFAVNEQISVLSEAVSESNTKILTDGSWTEGATDATPPDSNLGFINFSRDYMASDGTTYNFELKINSKGENVGKFSLRYNPLIDAEANIYLDSNGHSTAATNYDHTLTDAAAVTSMLSTWTDAYIATENLKTKLEADSWTNIDSASEADHETLTHVYYSRQFSSLIGDDVKFFIAIEKTGANAGKFELYTTASCYDDEKTNELTSNPTKLFLIDAAGAKDLIEPGDDLLVGADYSAAQIAVIINMYLNDLYLTSNAWTATTTDSSHLKYVKTVDTHVFTLKLESSGDDVNKFMIETGATNIDIHSDLEPVYTSAETFITAWLAQEIIAIVNALELVSWEYMSETDTDSYIFSQEKAGLTFHLELITAGDNTGKYKLYIVISSDAGETNIYHNIDGVFTNDGLPTLIEFSTNNAAATITAIEVIAAMSEINNVFEDSTNGWTADTNNFVTSATNVYTKTIDQITYTFTLKQTGEYAKTIELTVSYYGSTSFEIAEFTPWTSYEQVTSAINDWIATQVSVAAINLTANEWTLPDASTSPHTYSKIYSGKEFFIDITATEINLAKYTIYTLTSSTIEEIIVKTKNHLTPTAGSTSASEQLNSFTNDAAIKTLIINHLVAIIDIELLGDDASDLSAGEWTAGTDMDTYKVYTFTIPDPIQSNSAAVSGDDFESEEVAGDELTLHLELSTGMIKLFKAPAADSSNTATEYLIGSASGYADYYDVNVNVRLAIDLWTDSVIREINTKLNDVTEGDEATAWSATDISGDVFVYKITKGNHVFTLKLDTSDDKKGEITLTADGDSPSYPIGGSDGFDPVTFTDISTLSSAMDAWLALQIPPINDELTGTLGWTLDETDVDGVPTTKTYSKIVQGITFNLVLTTSGANNEKFKLAVTFGEATAYPFNAAGSYLIGEFQTDLLEIDTAITNWIAAKLAAIKLELLNDNWTVIDSNDDDNLSRFQLSKTNNIFTLNLHTSGMNTAKFSLSYAPSIGLSLPSTFILETTADTAIEYKNVATITSAIDAATAEVVYGFTQVLTFGSEIWMETTSATDLLAEYKTFTKTVSGTVFTLLLFNAGDNNKKFQIFTNNIGGESINYYVIGDQSTYQIIIDEDTSYSQTINSISNAEIQNWINSKKTLTSLLGISFALSEAGWTLSDYDTDSNAYSFTKISRNNMLTIEYNSNDETFQIFRLQTTAESGAPQIAFTETALSHIKFNLAQINLIIARNNIINDVSSLIDDAAGWIMAEATEEIKTFTKNYFDSDAAADKMFTLKIHLIDANTGKIWVTTSVIDSNEQSDIAVFGSEANPIEFIMTNKLDQVLELFLITNALALDTSKWTSIADEGTLKVYSQTVVDRVFKLKLQTDTAASDFKKIILYVDSDGTETELSSEPFAFVTNASTNQQIINWIAEQPTVVESAKKVEKKQFKSSAPLIIGIIAGVAILLTLLVSVIYMRPSAKSSTSKR